MRLEFIIGLGFSIHAGVYKRVDFTNDAGVYYGGGGVSIIAGILYPQLTKYKKSKWT